ncbi:hypothetical protein [Micromonospora sp. NPDC023737]|uniref:hypothetical protein n=1 Tax=unclassified Micromonospora TaxID=2617518 RepID=UPI003406333E
MDAYLWLAGAAMALTLTTLVVVVVLVRRRRRRPVGREAALLVARQAIRRSRRDQRFRARGTIRGKGQGGLDSQAISAGVNSESSGMP